MYKIVKSLNIFSETTSTVFTRFLMGPSVERMLTICSNISVPLQKMTAMPIYGKTLKNLLLQNYERSEAESGCTASGTKFIEKMILG